MYSLNQAIHCSQVKLIFPETEFKKVQIYFLWTYHAVHLVAPQHNELADHLGPSTILASEQVFNGFLLNTKIITKRIICLKLFSSSSRILSQNSATF